MLTCARVRVRVFVRVRVSVCVRVYVRVCACGCFHTYCICENMTILFFNLPCGYLTRQSYHKLVGRYATIYDIPYTSVYVNIWAA